MRRTYSHHGSVCVCEQDDCVVDGHSCSAHESCVDEHVDYSCDCVSDVRMEVLNGERCAKTLTGVGLMHEVMKLCQRGERLHA